MATLHITNGDCAADTLRLILRDPVTTMADVLHEGPCPEIDGDAWHQVRGRFLASAGTASAAQVAASLARGDRTVTDACRAGDEMVLWFEHDLFDQLAVIRTLDLLVRLKPDTTDALKPDPTDTLKPDPVETLLPPHAPVAYGLSRTLPRVSLICIDRFPGVDRFIGLGQLTKEQLATLIGTGTPMTVGHLRLARDVWHAFRSPDPSGLERLAHELSAAASPVSEGGPALPFLGRALLRFLAEYPSAVNGLSRTEELALRALDGGERTVGALFAAAQTHEIAPFMGDLSFFDILRRLASCRVPLVAIDGGPDLSDIRHRRLIITGAGRDVVAGRADHVRLNGIDVWRGGVHLTGSDTCPWRWDAGAETLIS